MADKPFDEIKSKDKLEDGQQTAPTSAEASTPATSTTTVTYCGDTPYGYVKSDVVPKFWRGKYEY